MQKGIAKRTWRRQRGWRKHESHAPNHRIPWLLARGYGLDVLIDQPDGSYIGNRSVLRNVINAVLSDLDNSANLSTDAFASLPGPACSSIASVSDSARPSCIHGAVSATPHNARVRNSFPGTECSLPPSVVWGNDSASPVPILWRFRSLYRGTSMEPFAFECRRGRVSGGPSSRLRSRVNPPKLERIF